MQGVAHGEQRRSRKQGTGIGSNGRAQEPEQVEAHDDIEGEIHAEHQELALGEIDDAHHAKDDSQPDTHQAVDRANQNAGRERLEKNLHEIAERRHVPWLPSAPAGLCGGGDPDGKFPCEGAQARHRML